MLFGSGCDDSPLLVNEQSARPSGADIDAKELDNSLLRVRPCADPVRLAEVIGQFSRGTPQPDGSLRVRFEGLPLPEKIEILAHHHIGRQSYLEGRVLPVCQEFRKYVYVAPISDLSYLRETK